MNQRLDPSAPHPLWGSLCARFAQALSPQRYARLGIVVAVSGGADSVALLRLITDVWKADRDTDPRQLIVAHYNHGVRGEHSAADQRFVAELAAALQLDFVTETSADRGTAAGEEPMRNRRYDFLQRTVAARGARCVLTAHTADDQIETVLHHLFRGTGPAGLCGIPASRGIAADFVLLRPLLGMQRNELRSGLRQIGQGWREDQSNDDLDYRRNWIRGELLPQIRSRYPAADQAILRLVQSQTQWHQSLDAQAQRWIDAAVVFGDDRVTIRRGPVEPAAFALAISSIWNRAHWPRQALASSHYRALAALVAGQDDTRVSLPGAIRAEATEPGLVRIGRHLTELRPLPRQAMR